MSWLWLLLALTAAQRFVELALAARNTRRLLAAGAVEYGRGHYPLFVALHAGWLAAMALLIPADQAPVWPLVGVYLVLQAGRLWVIASLGRFWTTRVISLGSAPLVRRGPYRWLRHPNYVIVVLELATLPLAFGAWRIALGVSVLNGLLLWQRLRVEQQALAGRPG